MEYVHNFFAYLYYISDRMYYEKMYCNLYLDEVIAQTKKTCGMIKEIWYFPGADPGFQVRGAHLKKITEILGVFRMKNHDFKQKNHIFFQF